TSAAKRCDARSEALISVAIAAIASEASTARSSRPARSAPTARRSRSSTLTTRSARRLASRLSSAIPTASARRAVIWARPAAAIERSRLAIGEAPSPCAPISASINRISNSRMDRLASGQFAKEMQAAEQAAMPARAMRLGRVAAEHAPGVTDLLARGAALCPLVEDACHVTGFGDALDRCHHNVSSDPGKTVHEREGIANKGGRDLGREGLHLSYLRVI